MSPRPILNYVVAGFSNLGSGIRESSTTVEHLELIRSTRFRVLSDLVS